MLTRPVALAAARSHQAFLAPLPAFSPIALSFLHLATEAVVIKGKRDPRLLGV